VSAFSRGRGHGAVISVTLPLQMPILELKSEPPPISSPAAGNLPPPPSIAGLRVLLVEDDSDARELLTAILIDAGASVKSVASVAVALDVFQSFRPQLLVSDIGLPEEDGYALMRRVRAIDPAQGGALPSLALTAYTRPEDRAKALAAGFTTHVGKPVNPADLLAALGNLATLIAR
jgi:CheY-like chemotaxis protein